MLGRQVAPVRGQMAIDAAEPWAESECGCMSSAARRCGHCLRHDTCRICRECSGRGCRCACRC